MKAKFFIRKAPAEKDWCYWCGERRDNWEIWFPNNAEHDPPALPGQIVKGNRAKYLRVCKPCIMQLNRST